MCNARNIIAAARTRVAKRMAYYRAVLFQLRPFAVPGLGTAAVDDGWRLFYDPKTVEEWGVTDTAAVLVHEIGHVIRRHADRKGVRDSKKWNEAADREINDDQPEDMPLPKGHLMPADIGMANGLTAEAYYVDSKPSDDGDSKPSDDGDSKPSDDGDSKPSDDGDDAKKTPGCGGKCGGCCGNPLPGEAELGKGSGFPDSVSAAVKEVARKKVAQAVVEAVAKGQGNIPGGLEGWAATEVKPPSIPWQRKLSSLVRGSLSAVAGRIDYTRRRPGRRYFAVRAVMGASRTPLSPAMYAPKPRVGIVLDVSGSMSGEFDEAFGETIGIVEAGGGEAVVYAADMDVRATVKVRGKSDLKKLDEGGGMGGTSIDVAIRHALKEKKHDILIVITDGYTKWPSQEELRRTRMLAVITRRGRKAPDWMPQVKIGGDN